MKLDVPRWAAYKIAYSGAEGLNGISKSTRGCGLLPPPSTLTFPPHYVTLYTYHFFISNKQLTIKELPESYKANT